MLSMLKLLATTLLLSSVLFANEKVEEFLEAKFKQNPAITSLKVNVIDSVRLNSMPDWNALIVQVNATLKAKPKDKNIEQKMIWFSNGSVITKELTDINTGESLKDSINPKFKESYYKKQNLVYGKTHAKYKVAIFSDPLCPFCGTYVPKAIEEMRKQPEKFAIYYYHLPLERLHPAAVTLSQAAIAAELKGIKNVVLRLYSVEVDPQETNVKKILQIFNRRIGTELKPSDLKSTQVQAHYKNDLKISNELMVNGTPTVFINGEIDRTKRLYQKVK